MKNIPDSNTFSKEVWLRNTSDNISLFHAVFNQTIVPVTSDDHLTSTYLNLMVNTLVNKFHYSCIVNRSRHVSLKNKVIEGKTRYLDAEYENEKRKKQKLE